MTRRQARNDYVLITNCQRDFAEMCEEMDNYYKELTEEIWKQKNY